MPKEFYRRNLPHWQPQNGVFNICFRLANSLPIETWKSLKKEHEHKIEQLRKTLSDSRFLEAAIRQEYYRYFVAFDKLIENYKSSPTWLGQDSIAQIVADSLHYGHQQGRYKLVCFSILPNHVHLILYKIDRELFKILQAIKGYTGRLANQELGHQNKPFWQAESYDNLISDRQDLATKIQYIVRNPEKAKLIDDWRKWKFFYLHPDFEKYV